MSERRSVFILFVGLMLCISLWKISLQELPVSTEYTSYVDGANGGSIKNDTKTSAPTQTVSTPVTQLDALSKNDATLLIDLYNFDYLINQAACDSNTSNIDSIDGQSLKAPFVLILIHSAPRNWHKRNVIRETWGQLDSRSRIFFLLGAVNTTSLQTRLEQENSMFQDIIQGNFYDAYRNMTYKHIMALKWMVYKCPNFKYLLKTDDDVFVNTPAVYDFLDSNTSDDRNYLFCFKNEGARVKRSYRSKWHVSTKEYSGWYYPPYCPGFSIIYSADVVFNLYKEAQKTRYFWIDDVHVTGTLAQNINVNITTMGKYYMDYKQRDSIFNGNSLVSDMQPTFLFTEPNLVEKQIRKLWKFILPSHR